MLERIRNAVRLHEAAVASLKSLEEAAQGLRKLLESSQSATLTETTCEDRLLAAQSATAYRESAAVALDAAETNYNNAIIAEEVAWMDYYTHCS